MELNLVRVAVDGMMNDEYVSYRFDSQSILYAKKNYLAPKVRHILALGANPMFLSHPEIKHQRCDINRLMFPMSLF